MKYYSRRLLITVVLLLGTVLPAFSKPWYLCLGSFKNQQNAQNFLMTLSSENLEVCTAEHKTKDGILYRVLINQPCETWEQVVTLRNSLKANKTLVQKVSGNIWACEVVESTIKRPSDYAVEAVKKMEFTLKEAEDLAEKADAALIKTETPEAKEEEEVTVIDDILEASGAEKSVVMPEPVEEPETKEESEIEEVPDVIVLKENELSIPLSEETPFSVLVRSYKEEQLAENDKARLLENEIDSYILKTYDDDTLLNFDLHSGAFATEEESEELQQKLETLGIADTKISNYKDIEQKIKDYEELIQNEKILFENVTLNFPDIISDEVVDCINTIPVNTKMQLEEVIIQDFDVLYSHNSETYTALDQLETYKENIQYNEYVEFYKNRVKAGIYINSKDNLFNKNFYVLLVSGDKGTFEDFASMGETKVDLLKKRGFENCYISSDNMESFTLTGISEENDKLLLITANDYSEKEFYQLISSLDNENTILSYPQIKKTILVLPDSREEVTMEFGKFTFSKVQEYYAADRNYADWATAIVGHWESTSYLYEDSVSITVSFFDLDYDFNAHKVHEMFRTAQKARESSTSYKSSYPKGDSWYSNSWFENELSFSNKSYVIAIDSYSYDENGLNLIADGLKIWD